MESTLAKTSESPLDVLDLGGLRDEAREYARRSKGSGTVALYSREWRKFVGWCSMGGFDALPADPEIVALYVTALSRTQSVASMNVAVAAISQAHQAVRLASPTQTPAFREVWRGIRRTIGVAPREQKAPATTEVVKAMLEELPDSLIGVRDRALILVAFATAMRRSEIVGLDFEDVRYVERGMEITVRRSKVDQEGVGHVVAVPYGNAERTCPIRALRAWIEAAGLIGGPLFRSVDRHGRVSDGRMDGGSVGRIVKRAVERTGRDPQDFGAHSTRAGFITSAAANGASEHSIAKTSNHRSVQVLRSYIRAACRFDDNAGSKLGL
ncbi:MAG: site-specific integrase [Fimbriimonadaceae bacterium]|nr:site-specific integrase [Fimbriimonadaceae bacterium]